MTWKTARCPGSSIHGARHPETEVSRQQLVMERALRALAGGEQGDGTEDSGLQEETVLGTDPGWAARA